MKKHLIVAAVAAAVSLPAFAQVAVSGAFSMGFRNVDTSKNTNTVDGSSQRGTSVLAISGKEDLGGGLSAGFVMEGTLATDDGKAGDGTNLFDRKSYVYVSGGFGTVSAGRVYTADESIESFSGMGWNLFDASADTGEDKKVGGKLKNTVRFDSASFAGVTVTATTTQAEDTQGTTSANDGGNQVSYGVSYKAGDLYTSVANTTRGMTTQTTDNKVTVVALGYKFSGIELALTHHASEADSVDYDYTRFGARAPIGNGLNVVGHYGKGNASTDATSFGAIGLGIEKGLSKRTTVWAGFKQKDFNGTGTDETTTAFGVDHKF